MEYLIRFAQAHESFRKAEIEALAALVGVNVEFLVYTEDVGCISRPRVILAFEGITQKFYIHAANIWHSPPSAS